MKYAEVTRESVKIYARNKKQATSCWGVACFALPINGIDVGVLVANTAKAVIRVVDVPKQGKSLWQLLKPSKTNHWDFVKSAFPIGAKMDETTHVFDGTMYSSSCGAENRFCMTALPINIAEEFAQIGTRKLKYLDTVESLIFKYYSATNDPLWVLFPQDDGIRILFLTNGMPKAAWYISNHPEFRKDEILRYLNGSKNMHRYKQISNTPSLSLVTDNRIFTAPSPAPVFENEEITLNKAVILNTDIDLEWLYELLEAQGLEVEKRDYCLGDYLT